MTVYNNSKLKFDTKSLVQIGLFAGIMITVSFISIRLPISPVPISGETFGVMLAGNILKVRQAILSIMLYIFLLIIGFPIFSSGLSGISAILGPTGGYIIGFILGVATISLIARQSSNFMIILVANIVGGIVLIYVLGVLWLSIYTNISIENAIYMGALPYILGDIIKALIASTTCVALNSRLKSYHLNIE